MLTSFVDFAPPHLIHSPNPLTGRIMDIAVELFGKDGRRIRRLGDVRFIDEIPEQFLDDVGEEMVLRGVVGEEVVFEFRHNCQVAALEVRAHQFRGERWKKLGGTSYDALDRLAELNSPEALEAFLRIVKCAGEYSFAILPDYAATAMNSFSEDQQTDERLLPVCLWAMKECSGFGQYFALVALRRFLPNPTALEAIHDYLTTEDPTLSESEQKSRIDTAKYLLDNRELFDQLLELDPDLPKKAASINREYYLRVEPDAPGLKCGACGARAETPFEYGDICSKCNAEKGCDY